MLVILPLQLCRCHSKWPNDLSLNFVQLQDFRLQNKWKIAAVSRTKASGTLGEEGPDENGTVVKKKTTRTTKRAVARTRKKAVADNPEDNPELVVASDATSDESIISASSDDSKKTRGRPRRKSISLIHYMGFLAPSQMLYINILILIISYLYS
jgi:hypothetical protein